MRLNAERARIKNYSDSMRNDVGITPLHSFLLNLYEKHQQEHFWMQRVLEKEGH